MKNVLLISGFLVLSLQLCFTQESCSDLMRKAYEQAAKEDKNVFVIFHASWCGWCKKMEKNINNEKCKTLFNSNYIFVYLTVKETDANKHLENPGASKLLKEYKGSNEGVPFWLIFDKEGKLIGDSFNKEGKNMGCPNSAEEVRDFMEKLENTSELTEEELNIIKDVFLNKKVEKKNIQNTNFCKEVPSTKIKKFETEHSLKSNPVTIDYHLDKSRITMLNDDHMLFYSPYRKDYCLQIVDANDFTLLATSGYMGSEHGEINNPGTIYFDKEDNNIWLSTFCQIYKFPVDSMLIEQHYKPASSIDGYVEYKLVMYYQVKDGSIVYFTGETEDYDLYKVSGEKIIDKFIEKHIIVEEKYKNVDINSCQFISHPTDDKIALCYLYDDVLVITNSKGEVQKRIKGPDDINPLEHDPGDTRNKTAYHQIVADDSYIYCLYSGKPIKSISENGVSIINGPQSIFIFDWKGNPVERLNLDKPVYSFAIDKQRNRIIAYSNDTESEIVYFDYDFVH